MDPKASILEAMFNQLIATTHGVSPEVISEEFIREMRARIQTQWIDPPPLKIWAQQYLKYGPRRCC